MTALFAIQPVDESVLTGASRLVDKHALRAYDALQLAAASHMGTQGGATMVFVCSDQQLVDVARAEGVRCFDPAQEPLE